MEGQGCKWDDLVSGNRCWLENLGPYPLIAFRSALPDAGAPHRLARVALPVGRARSRVMQPALLSMRASFGTDTRQG